MVTVRHLGLQDYSEILGKMREFTAARDAETVDEIWILQHPQVFTQGQAGKPEHLLSDQGIPVVQSDRGGQITYHGPGQLIVYLLLDIKRLKVGVRQLVDLIEQSLIGLLSEYSIPSCSRADAPGVYLGASGEGAKIAALGLRIRKGCSYHGLSLNVDMDLSPFNQINPCGMVNLDVTDMKAQGVDASLTEVADQLLTQITRELGYN